MPTSCAYAGNTYDEYDGEEYAPEVNGDQEDTDCDDIVEAAFGTSFDSGFRYGILDSGATSSVGSFELIQLIADAWGPLGRRPVLQDNGGKAFLFAGGEGTPSKVTAWMPNEVFKEEGVAVNVVPCTATPILIGLDMMRY